jgi:transposase
MRKISEVLRLRAAGLTVREIARSTGAGRTTVYEYLVRADAAGLTWPLPQGMGDDEVEVALFPPLTAELAERRPVPDWRYVHRGRHVTLRLFWLEWRRDQPDDWGYTQFCVHYRAWLGTQDVLMRLEYQAGTGATLGTTKCSWCDSTSSMSIAWRKSKLSA